MRRPFVGLGVALLGAGLWAGSASLAQDDRRAPPQVCNHDVEGQLVNGQVMPPVGRLIAGILTYKAQEGAVVSISGGAKGVMITKLARRGTRGSSDAQFAWQPGNIEPFHLGTLGLPLFIPAGQAITLASSNTEVEHVYFSGYELR